MKDNRTLLQGSHWQINMNMRYGVAGYLFVTHLHGRSDQFSGINPLAFTELGQFLGLASAALEATLKPEGIITGKFGMVPNFPLHFHVFPLHSWVRKAYAKNSAYHALKAINPAGYPAVPDAAELLAFVWREHCFTGISPVAFEPDKVANKIQTFLTTELTGFTNP